MNPLWVHLRVLHGTQLALSQVSVLRGNLRAHLIEGARNFDIVIYQ